MSRRRGAGLAALLALALVALPAAPAIAGPTQISTFQDDAHLVYGSPRTVSRTLTSLAALGVQRIRVTLKWADVAPAATSRRTPAGFAPGDAYAANPASYGQAVWAHYDRVIRDAARAGIGVQLNLTAPGPLWAMGAHPVAAKAANHWSPNAADFAAFVEAAGVRYSGRYLGLPRVSVWSVWNEPNQPGWLAPQWRRVHGAWVPNSPRLYRQFVGAAYLHSPPAGASGDTFLIGETAPSGYAARGALVAMKPLPFLRAVYCLDGAYRPLRGAAATALGCPATGTPRQFVGASFPLFAATGFAHHPYRFTAAPQLGSRDPDVAPLADLSRIERALDRAFAAYSIPLQLPIFLTEYGYQTNPPDPYVKVSLGEQARYLNDADHLAWQDPRVRSVAQFLLRDDTPDRRFRPRQFKYWDTFQTGLEFASGAPKPALAAYRIPVWYGGGAVWGQVRPAVRLGRQRARIEWQSPSGGPPRTLATVLTNPAGFLTARVRPPGRGVLRIAWQRPGGPALLSRAVAVR